MSANTLLSPANAAFLDAAYARWLRDPQAVPPEWRELFAAMDGRSPRVAGPLLPGETPPPVVRSIFHPGGGDPDAVRELAAAERQARLMQLVRAWRVRGHLVARIDPLGMLHRVPHPELDPGHWKLGPEDMDRPVKAAGVRGVPEDTTPREVIERLRQAWGGPIGAEFMNILDQDQVDRVIDFFETRPDRRELDDDDVRFVLRKLADAEGFERLLHTRYPGTKRFSLEGAETLIPLIELLVEEAAARGVDEIVMGMAHRGRLNVLANVLEKPIRMILDEFEDVPGLAQGSGDVKYHLGFSSNVTTRQGRTVHLSLTFNPSHLEAVDPVVEGRVRAKQDQQGDPGRTRCLPLLIHGDAAFAGQGLVAEVLNLSELAGTRTGGTIHVIVNNQIGFTTPPEESRSTSYATDVARMLAIPILHVNGEDVEAVAACVRFAVRWRQETHRDVVIDMLCYRRHGHNESDEPSFTQPLLYDAIRKRPTPREVVARSLVEKGWITQEEVDAIQSASREALEEALDRRPDVEVGASPLKEQWQAYQGGIDATADTRVPRERVAALLERANTLPQDFTPHPKIARLLRRRLEMARGERPLDWATAEQAAWATLLAEGVPVRICGQDSSRGTFSQRHAALADRRTGREIQPLQHLGPDQAPFLAVDSSLSEAGVLGFEYGYTLDRPEALVMWEAQFGDFANGAQVIIDQFVTSSLQKWNRRSGLVLLLPHGYEGQGPEHSSARPERFLLACANGNMRVANCTTPAQYFHLLREQVLRPARHPLVLFTPKSLLRHPLCTSTLDDLAEGRFEPVLPEADEGFVDPEGVRRIVFCSGKVYYDLLEARRERGARHVALVRVERLYPFPRRRLWEQVQRYPERAEVVWCQEEPRNMGPWPVLCDWIREQMPPDRQPRYVGRPPSASPATGSYRVHRKEQEELVAAALSEDPVPLT